MCTRTRTQAGFAEAGEALEFHVSHEVTILGISIFVAGLGLGPLFQGPLSEFYGRNRIYWGSYICFWIFGWPVTFAPNIGMFVCVLSVSRVDLLIQLLMLMLYGYF